MSHTTKTHRNMYNKRSELNFVFNWFWGTTKKKRKARGNKFHVSPTKRFMPHFWVSKFQVLDENHSLWVHMSLCALFSAVKFIYISVDMSFLHFFKSTWMQLNVQKLFWSNGSKYLSCRSFFFFQNSKFWMKITPCGFTSRYGCFFSIEIQLLFGDHVVWHFFKSVWMQSYVQKLFWRNR